MLKTNPKFVKITSIIARFPKGLDAKQAASRLHLQLSTTRKWCEKCHYQLVDLRHSLSGPRLSVKEYKRRRRILRKCVRTHKTLEETGRILKMSKQRVWQLYDSLHVFRSWRNKRAEDID